MALIPVPLPQGIASVEGLPRAYESLTNEIPVGGGVVSRPGADSFVEGEESRGSFYFQGNHYHVLGQELHRVLVTGQTEAIGTVDGLGRVVASVDHASVALVVQDGLRYEYRNNVLTPMTRGFIDVAQLDGIFVFVPEDGGVLEFSGVGVPSEFAGFFDAEALPDRNTGVMVLSNEFYGCGEDSIELFRHTGPDNVPLQRVLGGRIPIGYWGGKVEYKGGLAFVGNDDGPHIYSLLSNVVVPISTPEVDEILATYSIDELKAARGMRFNWSGLDILVFKFAKHTFAYTGVWFFLASGHDDATWRFDSCDYVNGKYWVGHKGGIAQLSDSKREVGDYFQRGFTTFFRSKRETNFTMNCLELDAVSQGEAGTVGLSLSIDGLAYGPFAKRSLPPVGSYGARVSFSYAGGLGNFESMAGIKIRTAEKVDFATDALWVDV